VTPGDIVLIHVPDVSWAMKWRPSLYLASLPGPYQAVLACGISTKLHSIQTNWDELIQPGDTDFITSGLRQMSVIRLSYLYAVHTSEISGLIGQIEVQRLDRLRQRLSDRLRP
jgi:mRNA interferase MazF